jgi:hypothetical protein
MLASIVGHGFQPTFSLDCGSHHIQCRGQPGSSEKPLYFVGSSRVIDDTAIDRKPAMSN